LLLFRIIYFLLPFAGAFLLVSFNEARNAGGFIARRFGGTPAVLRPAYSALIGIVPALVGTVAFGLGGYLLLVAMLPSVRASAVQEGELVAAILLEGGTLVSSVAGVVLLILSHGLVRRVSAAYWLTLATIAGGIAASLMNDLDYESALVLLVGGIALLPFSEAFHRKAKLTEGIFSLAWFALVLAILVAVAAFFLFVHAATPYSHDLWTEFSRTANTPRSLRAGLAASAVFLFFSVYLALQPARRRPGTDDGARLARAAAIVAAQDVPQACLALSGDKQLYFDDSDQGFVMYGRRGSLWIALGDPVAPGDQIGPLAWDFLEAAQAANCRPVFYEASDAHLPVWIEMGMALHKIGEEAVIPLPDFSLGGAKFKSMRAAFNKKQREGYGFEVLEPPHADALIAELREVSDLWLGGKAGREKGFSVGRFDPVYLDRFPIAVIRREGRIIAFANILAPGSGRKVAIDLMRYRPEETSGIMEFLFLSLIEHYRAAGALELSLGVAPLAGLSTRRSARMWNRLGVLLFRHGGAFYNFEGLRAFKQKFRPEWRPRYLALPPGVSPMMAMAVVALLISGGARGLVRK
jgi:phosphatidylglycerol lysyltransferase